MAQVSAPPEVVDDDEQHDNMQEATLLIGLQTREEFLAEQEQKREAQTVDAQPDDAEV
jgi:hypothetical protein